MLNNKPAKIARSKPSIAKHYTWVSGRRSDTTTVYGRISVMYSRKNSHMKTGHRNMRCGLCFYEFNVTPMSHVYTLDQKYYMQDGMITSYCNKIPKCYVRKISRLSLYMQIKHNHENKQKCQCDLSSVKWSVLFCFSSQLQPESTMSRFSLCIYIFFFQIYLYSVAHSVIHCRALHYANDMNRNTTTHPDYQTNVMIIFCKHT